MSEQETVGVRTNAVIIALIVLLAMTCAVIGWVSWAVGQGIIIIGGILP